MAGLQANAEAKREQRGAVMLFSGFKSPNCLLISLRAGLESCAFVARVRHSMPLLNWTASSERWLMGNVAYRVWVSFGKVECMII